MRSSSFDKAGLIAAATLAAASMSGAYPIRRYTPQLLSARSGQPDAADLERLALAQAKRERKQQKRVQGMLRKVKELP